MTLALAGVRRDAGVVVASINLKFIWDVVSQIKVGNGGVAYVVNAEGRLIAHPDISLVLRNTDYAHLPQVRAARGDAGTQGTAADARDLDGRAGVCHPRRRCAAGLDRVRGSCRPPKRSRRSTRRCSAWASCF